MSTNPDIPVPRMPLDLAPDARLGASNGGSFMGGRLSHNKESSQFPTRAERIYRPMSETSRIRRCVSEDKELLLSHKPDFQGSTIQEWANGQGDADMAKLKTSLESNIPADTVFYIALYHEPEDDVASRRFSAEDFRAAFRRFYNRVVDPMPNARSALCMMREVYADGPYDNPRPADASFELDPGENYVDLYAGDPYNPWKLEPNYQFRELEWLAAPMVGYAEQRGRRASVWETGCQNDERKPMWIRSAGIYARDAKLAHLSPFYGTGPRGTWDIEQGDGCLEELHKIAGRRYFNSQS